MSVASPEEKSNIVSSVEEQSSVMTSTDTDTASLTELLNEEANDDLVHRQQKEMICSQAIERSSTTTVRRQRQHGAVNILST
jgi:hypothetical protein